MHGETLKILIFHQFDYRM